MRYASCLKSPEGCGRHLDNSFIYVLSEVCEGAIRRSVLPVRATLRLESATHECTGVHLKKRLEWLLLCSSSSAAT